MLDETAQQVEGLGRQVELGTVAKQLPRLRVDGERAESNSHGSVENLRISSRFLKTLSVALAIVESYPALLSISGMAVFAEHRSGSRQS